MRAERKPRIRTPGLLIAYQVFYHCQVFYHITEPGTFSSTSLYALSVTKLKIITGSERCHKFRISIQVRPCLLNSIPMLHVCGWDRFFEAALYHVASDYGRARFSQFQGYGWSHTYPTFDCANVHVRNCFFLSFITSNGYETASVFPNPMDGRILPCSACWLWVLNVKCTEGIDFLELKHQLLMERHISPKGLKISSLGE